MEVAMYDIVFAGAGLVLIALMALYARALNRL